LVFAGLALLLLLFALFAGLLLLLTDFDLDFDGSRGKPSPEASDFTGDLLGDLLLLFLGERDFSTGDLLALLRERRFRLFLSTTSELDLDGLPISACLRAAMLTQLAH